MKPRRIFSAARLSFPLATAVIAVFNFTAQTAQAVTLYWDVNGTTTGFSTVVGAWNTGAFWNTSSTGGAGTVTATTTGVDDLIIGPATTNTGTITLTGTKSARTLTFGTTVGAVTLSGGTLSLAGGGGITVASTAGNPTISSNLTLNGNNIFDVGSGRTLTLSTGDTFNRIDNRATLSIRGAGGVSSTMTNLSSNVNNIIGPWASAGSGSGTTYAKFNGSTLSGLIYTGGADGTAAAASTNVISTGSPGTVNYNLNAAGTLGLNANINTLRYGGAAGTLATNTSFTTLGIMNAGTGLLTFSGAVTSGASGTEMVVNTANANINFDGIFTGTITKTGSGTVTLGNVANAIGGITVNEGILITNHSVNNGITGASTVNSGGTLRFGGSTDFGDTNSSFTINSGGTFDLGGFNDTIGSIAGAGSITTSTGASILTVTTGTQAFSGVIGGAVSLRVTGATADLTLSGANTYTGGTFINQGTLRIDTGGRIGSGTAATSALQLGSGVVGTPTANSVGNLILNTNNNAVGAITVMSNTADTTTAGNIGLLSIASGRTLTATSFTAGLAGNDTNTTNTALSTGAAGTGGTLTVTGNFNMSPVGGTGGVGATNAAITVVDLSGLTNFNVTSTAGSLTVGSEQNSKGTLTLANTANNINVGTLSVGDSTGDNYNIAQLSTINLGAGTNALSAPTLNIGAGKGAGLIQFAGAGGSVVITGANGAGTSAITIGRATNGSYQGLTNGLLLAGHDATVSASTVIIGQKATGTPTGGNINSQVTFDTGTFSATSISMAGTTNDTVAATAGVITGSFTVGGASPNSGATGVVNVTNNLLLANLLDGDPVATANGTLTINGGTVNVNTAGVTTQGIRDTSLSSAEASTTTLTLQGGTLNLNGGIIGATTVSGNRAITNLNFRSGTLQNVLQINGGAGLKKTTDGTGGGGTLILSGTNSFTGGVTIDAGTVQLGSAGALLTTADSENAVTFGAASTGTLALTGRGTVVSSLNTNASPGTTFVQNADGSAVSNATLTVGNSLNLASTYAGTIRDGSGGGTLALSKAGTGTLTLSGTNTYTGTTNVNNGKLLVDGTTSVTSVVTASNAGTLLGGNGTIGGATTMNLGTIHTAGNAVTLANISGAGTIDQVDFTTGITYNQGSIFEWNLTGNAETGIGTRGTHYDAVNTASLATTGTGAIFRVVLNAGQDFSEGFWNSDRTWSDIFEDTTGTDLNIDSIFGGGVQYYNASGEVTTVLAEQGSFSISGTELRWSAVPEPTSALAGLLLTAGLLRRRRGALDRINP